MKNKPKDDENIILENEKNDPALKKSMKQFRKTLIVILSIVILTTILSIVIFFINFNNMLSDPIIRIVSASQNTFTAYSAKIDAVLENTPANKKTELVGEYKIEPHNKKLNANFNIISKPINDNSKFETKIDIIMKFNPDSGNISYKKNGKTTDIEVKKEDMEQFFSIFADAEDLKVTNTHRDWAGFIENAGLEEYINSDKLDESLEAVLSELCRSENKEKILGLTEIKQENSDTIKFALNPYLTANTILENIKPIFKREEDYKYYRKLIDDNKSTLDNIIFRFDVTITPDGFLKELSGDNFGIKFNVKISNIEDKGTKIPLS